MRVCVWRWRAAIDDDGDGDAECVIQAINWMIYKQIFNVYYNAN